MRKLMTTVATWALVLVGALVALEAAGLIFRAGAPQPRIASVQTALDDPEVRAAALMWQQREEAEARRRAEADRRHFEAERAKAAAEAAEERKGFADALAWAEAYRNRREAGRHVAALGQPQLAATAAEASPSPQPQPAPPPARDADLKLAAVAAEPAPRTAGRPLARPDRAAPRRRHLPRAARTRCPFLGWLEAVMPPPAPRRGPT
jgi:hypothetical protein